jgi:hypothetical protein
MTEYFAPLSRIDLIKAYCLSVTVAIPKDSELHEFIQEEHWAEVETVEDCVIRLLKERMGLSRQGH